MGSIHTIARPTEILTLSLSGEIFALEAGIVSSILDMVPITHVPNGPQEAQGLINVRGKVVPLVDLRVSFDMPQEPATVDTRIVVIETVKEDEPTIVGILADKVYEVTEITLDSIEATPRVGMKWRPEFIRGISKRGTDFIFILDIENLMNSAK